MTGPALRAAVPPLTAGRDLLLVLAGAAAGIFNGVAGGGTLIAFPTLLAMGYPALTANVTTTVGIWPGYLGGVAGSAARSPTSARGYGCWRRPPGRGRASARRSSSPPPRAQFARLAPWLVLFAAALFAVQPLLLRPSAPAPTTTAPDGSSSSAGPSSPRSTAATSGRPWGSCSWRSSAWPSPTPGPHQCATHDPLGAGERDRRRSSSWPGPSWPGGRWRALALGSLLGGWAGAHMARRLPAPALRVIVVAIGVATAVKLAVG